VLLLSCSARLQVKHACMCRCYTSFQFGATGTDKNSVVLDTGMQLQKIGSLSITQVYADAGNAITGLVRVPHAIRPLQVWAPHCLVRVLLHMACA
jgi:hypothetical protein